MPATVGTVSFNRSVLLTHLPPGGIIPFAPDVVVFNVDSSLSE